MLTFQDFKAAVQKGRLIQFVGDAINKHRSSPEFKVATIADEYDRQQNTTIRDAVRRIYSMAGAAVEDFTASNNRIASNFFRRLNTQRCTYSLGNGLTYDDDGVREKLGVKFDTDLYKLAYYGLIHGVSFGFWNVDRLHVFPLTEFVPLYDEDDGTLRAGIRFWSLEWGKKPVKAVLYEEDGYTKFQSKGKTGLTLEIVEDKRAYKQTVAHTEAGGDEIIGEENYGSLPIVPLWGNKNRQSTLLGIRAAIDSFDLIQSGFANDLTDCAQIYWIVGNAMGMDNSDLQRFIDRIKLAHIAVADTDNSTVTPYTQDIPFNAREAYLNRIKESIYRDFGAFDPERVQAGNITATQIMAAYQPMDEEADDFEWQVIVFVQQILRLIGIEDVTPQFKRNRISNQLEQVQMIMLEANYLDDETVLDLLPNITPEMIPDILKKRDGEEAARFTIDQQETEPSAAEE